MKIIRLTIIFVSLITIILTLIFITDYHVLKSRSNLISLLLIIVSLLNVVSVIMSIRNEKKNQIQNGRDK